MGATPRISKRKTPRKVLVGDSRGGMKPIVNRKGMR